MEIINHSAEDTFNWAFSLAKNAKSGEIICLCGDLGAGKTLFAKGFGAGLGVVSEITSPTFTILNIYNSSQQLLPLYHFDVYRISSIIEMDDTGFEEFFYGNGVCLIEWAEIIKEIIPDSAVWIIINKDLSISDDYRRISLNSDIPASENIWGRGMR